MLRLRIGAAALGFCLACPPGTARADALADGQAALEAGQYQAAAAAFKQSARADPGNARIYALLARAYVESGSFDLALQALRFARGLGGTGLALDLIEARAEIALGRAADAAARLAPLEPPAPTTPALSYQLGRAYLALGQRSEAETAFAAARADRDYAQATEALLAGAPDPERATDTTPAGRWSFALETRVGFDDNALQQPEGLAVPGLIAGRRGSVFGAVSASAQYRRLLAEDLVFGAGHTSLAERHFDEADANTEWHRSRLSLSQRLGPDLRLTGRLTNLLVSEEGTPLYDRIGLGAELGYRLRPNLRLVLGAEAAVTGYFDDPADPRLNQDAVRGTGRAAIRLYVPGTRTTLGLSAAYARHETRGTAFDRQSVTLSARLRQPLPLGLSLDASLQREYAFYLGTDSGAGNRRAEQIDRLSLELTRDLPRDIQVFAGYAFRQTDANIPTLGYQQNVWHLGVRVRF